LQTLKLEGNQLIEFPIELLSLSKLNGVYLANNKIKNIPEGTPAMVNLIELSLENNQVASISPDLSKCPRLKTVKLSNNKLKFTNIPENLFVDSIFQLFSLDGNAVEQKSLRDLPGYTEVRCRN
ncbi:hypothetical protein SARC_07294, partial [Sphaeroforma arctica JP610]